ncbi:unnamed protein product [Soboliphyme baturini]|uniref:Protein kinase domain-containing protein n=1 Tax=Soboliphyme baturini TaxID=241478 RepID=A0A183IT29_9BILA|nr:unnamed protein product [Soboliphyme baturini]
MDYLRDMTPYTNQRTAAVIHAKEPCRRLRVPLQPSEVGNSMQRPAMAFMRLLPETNDGNCYILMACIYFTKLAEDFLVTATTVTRLLAYDVFTLCGFPRQLYSIHWRSFEAELLVEIGRRNDLIVRCRQYKEPPYKTTSLTGREHPTDDDGIPDKCQSNNKGNDVSVHGRQSSTIPGGTSLW